MTDHNEKMAEEGMTTNFVNPELATGMAACPIPPSDLEQAAIALMRERFDR